MHLALQALDKLRGWLLIWETNLSACTYPPPPYGLGHPHYMVEGCWRLTSSPFGWRHPSMVGLGCSGLRKNTFRCLDSSQSFDNGHPSLYCKRMGQVNSRKQSFDWHRKWSSSPPYGLGHPLIYWWGRGPFVLALRLEASPYFSNRLQR